MDKDATKQKSRGLTGSQHFFFFFFRFSIPPCLTPSFWEGMGTEVQLFSMWFVKQQEVQKRGHLGSVKGLFVMVKGIDVKQIFGEPKGMHSPPCVACSLNVSLGASGAELGFSNTDIVWTTVLLHQDTASHPLAEEGLSLALFFIVFTEHVS